MVESTLEVTMATFIASTLTRVPCSGKHSSTATCPSRSGRWCLNLHQRCLETWSTLDHWTATCTPLTPTTATSTGKPKLKDQSLLLQPLPTAPSTSLQKNQRQGLST